MKSASVLGAGSWGTALATVLAERGLLVTLWCRDAEHAAQMAEARENARYLPGVTLADTISPTADLGAAATAELIVCVVP